jgi:hypothetical protein
MTGRALHRAIREHRRRLAAQRQAVVDARHQRLALDHRRRHGGCERKTRYGSRAAADQQRTGSLAHTAVYRCPWCVGWHLTHRQDPVPGAEAL